MEKLKEKSQIKKEQIKPSCEAKLIVPADAYQTPVSYSVGWLTLVMACIPILFGLVEGKKTALGIGLILIAISVIAFAIGYRHNKSKKTQK
ncbi:MAG: hypothetical protein JXD21_07385 [Candidatus Omnitrophica bacterium]|nr:hypothetical protein [Candidatus Omnitrophota bacterium]